jgi:hypothetical protein
LPNEGSSSRSAIDEANARVYGGDALKEFSVPRPAELAAAEEEAKKAQTAIADHGVEESSRMAEAWASSTGAIAGSFIKAAIEGKKSWGDMVEDALTKLALLAAQQAAMQLGGPYGAFMGSLIGALGGGANGFDHVVGSKPGLELPGFARGGDFMVGGTGGVDSKIAMFRVTPGESVHVRTPEQQAQAARPLVAAPRVQNIIQVSSDPREITSAMSSYSGQREHVKLNRKFRRN